MPDDTQQPAAATPPATRTLPTVVDNGEFGMLMDTSKFAQLQRIGTMYARSKMVPSHFQGDEPSCMVAVQMAMRLNIDPFMFLQKTYVVSGKPGMEAPLVIALINTRGPFAGPIDWDLKKDDKGDVVECTAFATHKATGRVCSSTVTWKMVEAEGWSKKSGSKWLTLREQMFKYRSAAFLGRLYCPEVLMGMATADELHDQEIDVTPATDQPTPERRPRASLRERVVEASPVVSPAEKTTEDLISEGAIVIHVEPPAGAAGAAQVAGTPDPASGGAKTQPEPYSAAGATPPVPFDNAMKHAKKAKTQAEIDIVRDLLNSPAYSQEQRDEIEVILKSKKPTE
jgi:hypothetical protein